MYVCIQESFVGMWVQVDGVQKIVSPIISNATDGVNLICYSQGISPPLQPPSSGCQLVGYSGSRWYDMSRFH